MNNPLLKTVHLGKDYRVKGRKHIRALDDVNAEFHRNQIVALLGKNGSGKTTFIKSCCNLITYEGNICYDNQPLRKNSNSLNRYYASVLEGNRNVYWKLTVLENIRYFAALRFRRKKEILPFAHELLRKLYLYDRKDVLVERLSRGMQQKTALICAMVLKTPVLFLDEPTLGLDIESVGQMVEFFNTRELFKDRLICITSHNLEFVRKVVDDIIIIKDGQLLQKYNIDSLQENNNLVEIITKGTYSDILYDKCVPHGIVKKNRHGDYLSVVIDAGTYPLSHIVSAFENQGVDVYQAKRLRFDLETIYMLSQKRNEDS